jgi:hypothetical protein
VKYENKYLRIKFEPNANIDCRLGKTEKTQKISILDKYHYYTKTPSIYELLYYKYIETIRTRI